MPITFNHSNIGVQYSTGSNYIIETVKSDLYLRNEIVDTIVRDNLQTAPVTPATFVDNSGNVYAVESYTYSGSANTADYTRVFTKNTTCDILIVGGGGAGGNSMGGGGGAGGIVYTINQTLQAGNYAIGVGKGGTGLAVVADQGIVGVNQDGKDSFIQLNGADVSLSLGGVLQSLRGKGGGGGGVYYDPAFVNGRNGGSGGGCSETNNNGFVINTAGSATQGNTLWNGTSYVAGGKAGRQNTTTTNDYNAGGGGGAGNNGSSYKDGNAGVQINITGTSQFYAAGGGAGQYLVQYSTSEGIGGSGIGGNGRIYNNSIYLREVTSGTNGTGSGGGGGAYTQDPDLPAGAGGSGIVIIRYLLGTIPATNILTTEPTVSFPTFTETTRIFAHSGGAETQTTHTISVGRDTICDILVVGGGGGGGFFGGGGGSGSILFASNLLLNAGSYTIKVGKGGTGASGESANGTNGINSSILINAIEYISKGGGGGGTRQSSAASYVGRNGNDGGSGGGGSHSNSSTVQALGGSSNKNTYTGWLSYGNNGGKGRLGVSAPEPSHASGGGGGAGSAGENAVNSRGGGNGGYGLNLSSTFGTSVGHSGWFGGGGGGNTYYGAGNPGYGNGGNGLLGGGGNGGFDGGSTLVAQDGLPNTGGGGGGSKISGGSGGSGGSGIVIIKFKSTTPILEGITHKRLNFALNSLIYDFTPYNNLASWTAYATSIGATTYLNYGDSSGVWHVPANGNIQLTLPNGYNQVKVNYNNPHVAGTIVNIYIDNVIKDTCEAGLSREYIQSYTNGQVLRVEEVGAIIGKNLKITLTNTQTYTLNFPVPTIADINNNTNIVLRGVYDIALSTSNAVIIPKAGQYIHPPTIFSTSNLSLRYHLLNPILDPIGAQWTYNSSNTNVYHMGRVGIGTTSPEYQLDVSGTLNAKAYYFNGVQIGRLSEGMVANVQHLTYTHMEVKNNTGWDAINDDLTKGFVISITPKSNLSKILVNLIAHIGLVSTNDGRWWGIKLYRKIGTAAWAEVTGSNGTETGSAANTNGTPVWISNNMGTPGYAGAQAWNNQIINLTGTYLDSPNTTSTVYYTAYWNQRMADNPSRTGELWLNRAANQNDAYRPAPSSSWTVKEIWYG